MGEHEVLPESDQFRLREFTQALLRDLWALGEMVRSGLLESGIRRVGAEQEMFLVQKNMRPAPIAMELLGALNDPRFVTELARFNLEANITPLELHGRCLRIMEAELEELLGKARGVAAQWNAQVLLTGILPTLTLSDLTLDQITDSPRYRELNRALTEMRGSEFFVHIKGLDELNVTSNSMMLEACNTSFQLHYQVDPQSFCDGYNFAQAVTAPLLAASVNSPLLFRKRLWQETRLALFQRSVDERSSTIQQRARPPRVGFGNRWMYGSIIDFFHQDTARYRVIMTVDPDEDPQTVLERGEIPKLTALRVHNGTVWHWNRPCYGILDGRPHLRIENRVLSAGPSIIDQMANAAMFFGLMQGMPLEYPALPAVLQFDHAKENFYAAARHGLNSQFTWVHGKKYSASDLILQELLPLAREGLTRAEIDPADIRRYLGVLEERVHSGKTGSAWILQSLQEMGTQATPDARAQKLTESILQNQRRSMPVHCWEPARVEDEENWMENFRFVGQFMTTDLFTVRPGDLVDLAACIMDWEHVRHVPVEDDAGKLVGLISHRDLLRLLAMGRGTAPSHQIPVRDIMKHNPITVSPETPTLEAIEIMRKHRVGCLPVVRNDRLTGIITLYDLLGFSSRLLESALKDPAEKGVNHDSNYDRQNGL